MGRTSHSCAALRALGALPLTAWLVLAGTPASVRAQDQPQSTENGATALAEVTVTATRREESLSKVPISVTALTQEALDDRGIKDFSEVARFTPGVNFDNSGTNNISIRGISGTGGAGTTGIYIDDTPIQMRALAFNPDEALPKSFDIDRVEVLRGPQGTLFGSGSEGGTVRYITTQPSLTKTSIYAARKSATTKAAISSYEAGVAVGGPLIEGTFGARLTVWYRRDGGWIDQHRSVHAARSDKNANHDETALIRLAGLWAPSNEHWSVTPSIYYQGRKRHNISDLLAAVFRSGQQQFRQRRPDGAQLTRTASTCRRSRSKAISVSARLISNTSFYHRENTTGYEGTLYNLGYYQTQNAAPIFLLPWLPGVSFPLLDANGLHVPGGLQYRAPARPSTTARRTSPRRSACSRPTRRRGCCGPPACSPTRTARPISSRSTTRCSTS